MAHRAQPRRRSARSRRQKALRRLPRVPAIINQHQENRRRWGRRCLHRALRQMYIERGWVDYVDGKPQRPRQRFPKWVLGYMLMSQG